MVVKNKYEENVCPICGHDDSSDFDYFQPEIEMSESVSQEIQCLNCYARWTQLYSLEYVTTLNIKEKEEE